jgi:ubiquinone/menaquinone biosynthesis C-methylase UbiE
MNFDRIAPFYQLIESVTAGSSVQKCRTALLRHLAAAKSVLLIGEGNGRFLITLLEHFPDKQITVVESSARMLQLLRKRLAKNSIDDKNLTLIEQDIRDWDVPAGAYDAIVTNFFLDCFKPIELQTLIHKISHGIKPNGLWLVADFGRPNQLLRGLRAEIILKLMYGFFRRTARLDARRLTAPDEHLEDAGFHLREREVRDWGLLHADVWEFDRHE